MPYLWLSTNRWHRRYPIGEAKKPHRAHVPNLDDSYVYSRLDPTQMWRRVASLPVQARQAWDDALALELPAHYGKADKMVLAGMGGSAIGGDLLADLLSLEPASPLIAVCRDFRLPPWVNKDTLVVACSYSGNTEETLSCFREAVERGAKVVVITSGGRLMEEAMAREVPCLTVRYQGEPRTAVGYTFVALLRLVQKLGLTMSDGPGVGEALAFLEDAGSRYLPDQPTEGNPAKRLAHSLAGRLVLVYGAGFLKGVARRWKTEMNENAKVWAFSEAMPELNHNSAVGYQFPAAVSEAAFVVMLQSPVLGPQMAVRYRVTAELLQRAGIRYETITAEGPSPLAQMLATTALGDWASYYLAVLNGVDPSPVPAIDYLKQRLAQG